MDEEALAMQLVNAIELKFWVLLSKIILAGLVAYFIKFMITTIAGYYFLRMNKHIAIGVTAKVDNFEGIVTTLNMSEIVLVKDNESYVIPMKSAFEKNWIFVQK